MLDNELGMDAIKRLEQVHLHRSVVICEKAALKWTA